MSLYQQPFFATLLFSSLLSLALSACNSHNSKPVYDNHDGPPSSSPDAASVPDAVPQPTTPSKYGNPKSYEVMGKRYYVMSSSKGYKERGIASWYGSKFHGKRTSSGEPYNMHAMTAAHKTLPLPTYVKVTNLKNGRQVILKVNDRGPFHENRIIDLSHTAAVKLGIKPVGTGFVEVEAIDAQTYSQTNSTIAKPKVSNSGVSLYLQLGAFISAQNAQQLQHKINSAAIGQSASISTIERQGQQFYRVRIGPLENTEQADALANTLNNKGFNQYRIIIE